MDHEQSNVNKLPLPDARTAYHLRRAKDKVAGAVTAWDVVQTEYWPALEMMEALAKAQDRNARFILWVAKQIPEDDEEGMKYRNEIHRRVDLAFHDPDKPGAAWHTDDSYFEGADDSPIILAKDVVEREVEWLWPGRVPLGKQTTLAGPGGVGKSFMLCDFTARISTGAEWPFSGGERAPIGNVLYISGEDDKEDTIVPRLRIQGADLGRVAFLTTKELIGFNLSGVRFREVADRAAAKMTALTGSGFMLIVIDPPSSFLAGIDENSNSEVRGFLTPMKEWGSANNCAVIFNSHVNKAAGKKLDVQQRVIGSVAMVNGPRAAHMVTISEDDPDVKLFVPLKMNLWERTAALSFRIVRDLHEVKQAKLEWVAEVDINAGDAVNGKDEKSEKITSALQAERWLVEKFRNKNTWQSKDLLEYAAEELGDDQITAVRNARSKLGIQTKKVGAQWVCWVPENWTLGQ